MSFKLFRSGAVLFGVLLAGNGFATPYVSLNSQPLPPLTDGLDCGSVISGSNSKMCFRVPVIYRERTAGQAMDLALQLNKSHAAKCTQGFVLISYGSIDVKLITLVNGSVNGAIDEVEVRQNYSCQPW